MHRLIAPALLTMALAAPAMAETRSLTNFDSVNASDRLVVEVSMGQAFAIDVDGPDANKVETRIQNGVLHIRQTNRPWFGSPRAINATVHVTMPAVQGLAASRGASLRAHAITADDMSLAAAMGGELEISGACRSLSAAASMGVVVDADAFECETADVAASMGGEANVFASASFDGAASMGGTIEIAGGGHASDTATSMGGTINYR
ncbi:MAG: DUF2807 domain-containing protein [Hyphomonadaceae bacterium]